MKLFVCTVLLIASSSASREKRGIYGELDGLLSSHSLHHAPLSSHGLHSSPLYSPLHSHSHYGRASLHSLPLLSSHSALTPHTTPIHVSHTTPLHIAPLHSSRLSYARPLSLSHSSPYIHSAPLSHSLAVPLDNYHYSHHSEPLHLSHSALHHLPSSLHHHSYPHSHSLHNPVVVKVIKAVPARYASGWW